MHLHLRRRSGYTGSCPSWETDSFVPSNLELADGSLVSACGLEEQSSFPG